MARNAISGFHALEEIARTGKPSGFFLLADTASLKPGPRIRSIRAQAEESGFAVKIVPESELNSLNRDNRGMLFLPEEGAVVSPEISLDLFLEDGVPDKSLVLVLDGITDPRNFGAILRSSDQFGIDLVILPNRRSAKETDSVARSSAGAVSWVRIAVVPNLARALDALKEKGYWVYGADMAGDSVRTSSFSSKAVLVLGSEGRGIDRNVRDRCDAVVAVPSRGKVDSLNVSVAAGIMMYEIRCRQDFFAG
jgi:23S rRNA (guanosine2251-2'-O)-methyltransferase